MKYAFVGSSALNVSKIGFGCMSLPPDEKEAIPVISMFVGEKIISQLKELFLEELKELFPSIMSQFIGNLSQSGDLKREIVLKLQSVSIAETEIFFLNRFRKQLRKTEVGFAVAGFISGIIQLLLTLMILK